MQQSTWFLVANACEAKLYRNTKRFAPLELIEQFFHPESRNRNTDMAADRSGNFRYGGTAASGAMVEASNPKLEEAKRFAAQLAGMLDSARARQSYARLVIVASAPFLGLLNARLNDKVRKLVGAELQKDYTQLPPQELLPTLRDQGVL